MPRCNDADRRWSEWERDIHRRGTEVGWFVLTAAAVGGIALVVLDAERFWVANALVAGLLTAELAANVTRVTLYRRVRRPAGRADGPNRGRAVSGRS